MSADAIWRAFSETGDPLYYLLYKAAGENTNKKRNAPKNAGKTIPLRRKVKAVHNV